MRMATYDVRGLDLKERGPPLICWDIQGSHVMCEFVYMKLICPSCVPDKVNGTTTKQQG